MGNETLTDSQIIAIRQAKRNGQASNKTPVEAPTANKNTYTDSQIVSMRRAARAAKAENKVTAPVTVGAVNKTDYVKSLGLVDGNFEYQTVEEYDAQISKLRAQIDNHIPNYDARGATTHVINDRKKVLDRIETLKGQRNLLERQQKVDAYGSVQGNADFAQRSAVDATIEDDTYRWINDIDGYRGKAQDNYNREITRAAATGNSDFPQGFAFTMMQMQPDYQKYHYDLLNDGEIQTYNYLAATDPASARQFLKDMQKTLQKRYSVSEEMDTAEAYEKASGFEKGLMNVASVPMKVVGDVMGAGNDLVEAVTGNYSPYGTAHSLTNMATTIRSSTSQDIVDAIDAAGGSEMAGQIASNVYQALMSGADSVVGGLTLGKGYLIVAGAGAASQKAKELYEKGASGRQIFAGALASGAIEIALEKLPLDELLNAKATTNTLRGVITATLKQSGIEATGEALTELTNIVADSLIQGANSDLATLQRQYESEGKSAQEAYKLALRDKAVDVAWSGFGGFISGGASGFTFSATGLIQHNAAIRQLGQDYINGVDGHSIDEALAIGNNNAHTTAAYKLAQSLSDKVQNGQNVSASDVGRMLYESSTPEAAKARALDAAVRESAAQYGVSEAVAEDVANIAAATGRTIQFATETEFGVTLDGDATVAGSYDPATGIVKINAAATPENITNFIIKHELTHSVESTKQWDQLADIVQAQMGDAAFNDEVAKMMETYAASGHQLDMSAAEQEVVANWIGNNLYKGGFAQAIVNGDATIGNAFVRTIDKLRLALGNKKSRANTRLEVVERLFMRALEQDVSLRDGDAENLIITMPDGKQYVKADRQVIHGNNPTQWAKQVKDYIDTTIRGGEDVIVYAADGDALTITKDTSGKARFRNDVRLSDGTTRPMTDEEYAVKLRAEAHIDELATVSTRGNKVVPDAKSHNFARDGFNYRTAYFMDHDGQYYRLTISVGKNGLVNTVYNVGKIKEAKYSLSGSKAASQSDAMRSASNTNIAENANGVNTQSMQNARENTQTPKDAVVNRAWMLGDTTVDWMGRPVDSPVHNAATAAEAPVRSQVQSAEATAAPSSVATATATKPTTAPRRVESVNHEALRNAQSVDEVVDAVGDEEAYRRAYMAAQIERPRGTLDVNGRTMSVDEYMAEQYHSLPDDEGALRDAIGQTEAAIAQEMKRAEVDGERESSTLLKLNIQLFAEKAKLDYVLDKGEEGSVMRRFFEQRLKGKDANHNQELVDLLAGRSETYNPIANQTTLDKANARLRDAKYADKLRRRILRYKPNDMFTDVEMAAAQVMINDAKKNGEIGDVADMIQGLSRKGTELGRAVQIMSMQARLTPEGTLRAVERTIQKAADKVIGEGASDSIDQIVGEIINEMEARPRTTPQSPASVGEGGSIPVDISGATREQLRDALVEDLAATSGNYLSKKEIAALVDKVIDQSSNIPEQVRRYIKKHIGKGTLAERIYEMQQKGHLNDAKLRRAMEEALGLPTLTESEIATVIDLATKMHGLDDDPIQQAEIMDELYDMLGRKLPKTAWEILTSWRKFGMLFNLKTHLRNFVSNAVYLGVRKADEATAMMIERLFVRDKSKWGARLGWRKTEHGRSILPALEKSADLAVLQMQKRGKYEYGNSPLDNHQNLFGTSKLADTKFGKAADEASRWNSDWLERVDIKFFRPAYIDALGQIMTARGMTEITDEVQAMAYQRALEATFRADNAISDAVSNIKRGNGTKGSKAFGALVDVVMPFNKTPANILMQSAMHSPIGLVKGALDLYNATRGKGSKTIATAINTMAKGMTGTALLIAGLLLGGAGYFNTGYGKTEKERAADELAGIQENSFIIGGQSISVDWLQPAAAPLIVGASIAERFQEEGLSPGTVFGSVMDGTDALFDLSMMQSLYDIFGGYDTGVTATLGSVAENLISQSIPTVVGQAARIIDPVQRKTKGNGDFETLINKVIAKVPVMTYLLDPELDVWGEEVHRTGKATEWSWALNVLQQLALPSNIKVGTGSGDAISEEVLRLYNSAGEDGKKATGAIPTAISRDEARDDDLDYVESNRILGAVNRRAVEDFINNKWPYTVQQELPNGKRRNVTKFYEDMTDEERVRVLKRIYTKSKKQLTEPEEADDSYFADIMRRLE